MQALHRHQLAYLRPAAWREIAARSWDPVARECLEHWADHDLPLVVTRQAPHQAGIALGISAPLAWDRRRIALRVAHDGIDRFENFPLAREACSRMPTPARFALERALARLGTLGMQQAYVYGSHGWQIVTGLPCTHAASDIDLWIGVDDAVRADAVAHALSAAPSLHGEPRLDGEVVLPDGSAVAWREWAAWRAAGMRGQVLVKHIEGAALEDERSLWGARPRAAMAPAPRVPR